jgi:type IV pilus assembly protein PilW
VNPMIDSTRSHARGFSLIELMVAMAIGLFGVIVMMQVYVSSESSKRNTTSGADAMNEGIMAVYALQRDVRMGGFGIADARLMGCDVLLRTGVTLNAMAPVTINHASIPAGDANTDTLLVVYATTSTTTQGDEVIAATEVQTPSMFAVNDWVIQAPDKAANSACSNTLVLDQVATVTATPSTLTLTSGTPLVVDNTLFNLGPGLLPPKIIAYAIRGGNLTQCDYNTQNCGAAGSAGDATVWVPVASNIVSLRAQYGRDTSAAGSMLGVADTYDQTMPTPAIACSWARVPAVRLALVARSAQAAAAATAAAPVWEGSATNPINLTCNTAWQNYRYKVFQTVIPVRNITWMGVVAGC